MVNVGYRDFTGKKWSKWIAPSTWGGVEYQENFALSLTTYLEKTVDEEPWRFFWLADLQDATLWDWYRDEVLG